MRVVDALAQLPAPLVIVLDDVQHLRDRDVLESIAEALGPTAADGPLGPQRQV